MPANLAHTILAPVQPLPTGTPATDAFVRSMVARSATPFERLNEEFEQGQASDPVSMATYMSYWAQVLSSDGKPEKLNRFLEFAGLGETELHQMLAPAKLKPDAPLPAWAGTLAAVLDDDFEPGMSDAAPDAGDPIPFEEVMISFVRVFRKRLRAATGDAYEGLTAQAHREVERFILLQISSTMGACLFPEFQQHMSESLGAAGLAGKDENLPDDHYYQLFAKKLLSDRLQSFFARYPMLARITANLLHQHIGAFTRFLQRLSADRAALPGHFGLDGDPGKVSKMGLGVSDPHKGGEGVMILSFESGWKLVYKPRNMDMGLAYNHLLAWINARLEPQLKILAILAGEDYGWIEFAPHDACADEAAVERYYERAGMLLGITYVLDSTDFHAENVIACGEHPVLVDFETLLQPQFKNNVEDFDEEKKKAFDLTFNSVLRTALLPMTFKGINVPNDSISGFGGIKDAKIQTWIQEAVNTNSDKMVLIKIVKEIEIKSNLPVCNDTIRRLPAYQSAFEKGFHKAYTLLAESKHLLMGKSSPLSRFRGIGLRLLFRSTQIYALILGGLSKPEYLKDANLYGLRLELLARAFLTAGTPPKFWPMLRAERAAMIKGDVPCYEFDSNSDNISVDDDHVIESYFQSSCISSVHQKLTRMGEKDLNEQIVLIQRSIQGDFNKHNIST